MNGDDLLNIGAFAAATGLTIPALRHYDEIGLLKPAQVDPCTGYRRYRQDQLDDARLVCGLRAVGVPIGEVRADIRDLRADMNRRFDRIDGRFDHIDGRFDHIDGRFDYINGQFQHMDRRFERLETRFDSRFMWLVGLQFATFMTIIAALLNGYFR